MQRNGTCSSEHDTQPICKPMPSEVTECQSGAKVLGAKAILAQDPLTRPDSVACSPAPLVHAATKAARKMFYAIYAEFVSAFRAAAEAFRQGCRDVSFPAGSFPPAPPFVPS